VDTCQLPFSFEFIAAPAENIPADDNSFDTVVITYTLCTIADTRKALSEIRRVLKPAGKLLFCEHGESPEKSVRRWQHIINPIWSRLGGGCNLTRNIPVIVEGNGFKIHHMDANYIQGWKPASFDYRGIAIPN
jgi:SAM-dependent methyltransferase